MLKSFLILLKSLLILLKSFLILLKSLLSFIVSNEKRSRGNIVLQNAYSHRCFTTLGLFSRPNLDLT